MNRYEELKECFPKEVLYKLLWEDNKTFRELGKQYDYSERLFSRLSKEYQIPKNNIAIRRNSNELRKIIFDLNHIKYLYSNNKSTRQIGKIYNCQHQTVVKFLIKNNILVRDAHDKIYYKERIKQYSKHKELDNLGYVVISVNGIIMREHRYVMEQHLDRKLSTEETVHHIDFDKTNNDISNLYLFNNDTLHLIYHSYVSSHTYIFPSDFLNNYELIINNILSYDYLHNKYIKLKISANQISLETENLFGLSICRQAIINYLKKYNIYNMRKPQVNQYE